MDILETQAYDRRERRKTSLALLLSLLPFLISCSLYFHLWIPESAPSPLAAAVKAAPTLSLALVVLCHRGGRGLAGVAGGLLFSAAGDTCLIWTHLFLHGMACFAAAHLLYSLSFLSRSPSSSSSPLFLPLSLALWAVAAGFYAYLLPYLAALWPAVGVYSLLLAAMATLALRAGRALGLLGALLFMASDLLLALLTFRALDPAAAPWGHAVVMVTYYLAQLLIAVGDVRAGSEVAGPGAGLGNRKRK
ncbi:lysoplasmalogenase [Lepisosteus oculatus]|uniref:lysoplasmalogenase n=1 Tax=Lepisosteus oculatus TaxID=7918 RepID=UPI0037215E55